MSELVHERARIIVIEIGDYKLSHSGSLVCNVHAVLVYLCFRGGSPLCCVWKRPLRIFDVALVFFIFALRVALFGCVGGTKCFLP